MSSRRALWLVLCAFVVVTVLSAPALAQRRKKPNAVPPYKIGQRVMVNWHGTWVPGIVTDLDHFTVFGHVRVKTKELPHGWPFELPDIRPLKKEKAAETVSAAAATDPFATDEEKFDKIGRRSWTDTTGKFKIEARIARLQGDAVVLKRDDGKEITVPVAKLSPEDRTIIKNLVGPSRGQTDDDEADAAQGDSWFEEEEFLNENPAAAPEVKTLEVDTARAKPLDLGAGGNWTYAPRSPPPTVSPVRISLGGRRDFHDHLSQVLFSPDMARAFVIIHQGHRHETPPRVIACDLKEGAVSQQGEFFSGQLPLAISPDGKTLVARSDGWGFGKSNTLYVHRLEGYKATPQFAWIPYAMQSDRGSSQDIAAALFVDDEHLLTVSQDGVLYIWSVAGEKVAPLYFGQLVRGSGLAVSANRDAVALRSESGVAIVGSTTGASLGFLPLADRGSQSQLALRRDGKQLAMVDNSRIRVWDLNTQELVRDFSVSNMTNHSPIAWADDQRLVAGGRLIDVEKRVLLWQYTNLDDVVASGGGLIWVVSGEHSAGSAQLLIGAALPHAAAKAAADQLDAEEVLAIKPGMEVGIQLQFAGSVADQESVRKALSQRLEEVGLKPTGQSAVMLTASITPGESEKVQYQPFGSLQATEHTVTKKILELALTVNGKKVWKVVNQSWTPHIIHMQQGESIDQAIAREMNIDPKRFASMFVPGYVAKPKDESGAAYGSSPIPGAL